jgi:hypothetical protein
MPRKIRPNSDTTPIEAKNQGRTVRQSEILLSWLQNAVILHTRSQTQSPISMNIEKSISVNPRSQHEVKIVFVLTPARRTGLIQWY